MESTESVISFSIERMIRHLHGVGSVVHTVTHMGLECLGVWKHRRQTGRRIDGRSMPCAAEADILDGNLSWLVIFDLCSGCFVSVSRARCGIA